jgi:hypothetical protein
MNFENFLTQIPELQDLEDLFVFPGDKVLLAASTTDGSNTLTSVQRNADINDPDTTKNIGVKIVADGLLTNEDLALGGVAAFKIYDEFLKGKNLYDLRDYYTSEYDSTDGKDYLQNTKIDLEAITGWGDLIGAAKLAAQYAAAPISYEKAKLAEQIMENALYWGVGFSQQRTAFFSDDYVNKLISSFESLVEFTDLRDMSAVNFLWQLHWSLSGGRMAVCKRWNSVPEYYMQKSNKAKLHLKSSVDSVESSSDGKLKLTISNSDPQEFDIVINTADTDVALKMQKFSDPVLEDVLKSNTYTATLAIHVEIDSAITKALGEGAGLVTEPGFMDNLGGIMIQSFAEQRSYNGRDIIGLFAKTPCARDLVSKYSDENTLKQQAFKVLTADLMKLAQRIGDSNLIKFANHVQSGSIVSFKAWGKALPEFRTGYVGKVIKYRNEDPKIPYFYMGQALYGRSIVMVIPGVEQDFPKILNRIKKLKKAQS